ncbi:MAG: TetR family transcriptional regulator [Ilumatobacteraceae bacterium]|nr:TetR family transcriptional regulator [Ilumatobacteraceae bacterium]
MGDRLTMRRLADELGIQAPSLYKHFADKESITTAVHVDYLVGQVHALEKALADETNEHPLFRLTKAYRAYAREHEQLYRYVFLLPYPTEHAGDTLKRLRVQWMKAAGDSDLAIAAYALARGMVDMEIHSLYPVNAPPTGAYAEGLAALVHRADVLRRSRAAP